jgi:hydrogenase expression/formation protein HypE
MSQFLKPGKLDLGSLAYLIGKYTTSDERVVVGPLVGEDASVISFGDTYLVVKTDPITFATDEIGWYAVNVNANDVATMGARASWFLSTILLPPDTTDKDSVEHIFQQISSACSRLGISWIGGHTEITIDLPRPIVVGQMIGEVTPDRLVTGTDLRVGDSVVLTKGLAVEGTSIIAREKEDVLRGKYSNELVERCKAYLHDPGISVVTDAEIACFSSRVHAMHDPTEGGLANALHEMARLAGVGMMVDRSRIKIFPETALLCEEFGLDPLGLIASGALLVAVDAEDSDILVGSLRASGLNADVIAKAVPASEGITMCSGDCVCELPYFAQDETLKIFGQETSTCE